MIPKVRDGMLLAGDIEANGLLDEVTKLWCIACEDIDTEEMFLFHDYPEFDNAVVVDPFDDKEYTIPARNGSFIEGVRFWYKVAHSGGKLIVHNCMSYDKKVLEKFYPKFETPIEGWHDTFLQSKLQWYDRPQPKGAKSPHGLNAFGIRLGVNKPDIKDWTTMDAFKLHRCIEDIKIQSKTYKQLEEERRVLKDKLGIDFTLPFLMDLEYANNCATQALVGAKIDLEHGHACVEELDIFIESLRSEVEPQLPFYLVAKTQKIPNSEMARLLGRKPIVDKLVPVKRNGEVIQTPVKFFRKPHINFLKVTKKKTYRAFHDEFKASPLFEKKNLLSSWLKENYLHIKMKDCEVVKGEVSDSVLNKATCDYFGVDERSTEIWGSHTRISWERATLTQHEQVKFFLVGEGWKPTEWNMKKVDGQIERASEATYLKYPATAREGKFVATYISKGQPLLTSPKLTEDSYDSLPDGLGKQIAEYNTYQHRRRFLLNPEFPEEKGILAMVRDDGRLSCEVNISNTATLRSTHSKWVNPAGEGALYGENIRKCIVAPEGKVLLGADMASAQLAISSYYAKNSVYYEAVASGRETEEDENGIEKYIGQSAHCFSARLFDLVSHKEWQDAINKQDPELLHSIMLRRKKSKGASFGVIFGCSGNKLAGMLGIPENQGEDKKEAFLTQMGLKKVQEWLKTCKKKYPRAGGWYIPLPMGYWVFCKSDHKSLNYIVQGTEAVCQKLAINYLERKIKEGKLDVTKILDMHDENLAEASLEDADAGAKLMCEAYEYASNEVYKWHTENPDKFPNQGSPTFAFNLDGGCKVSKEGGAGNYLQTH